MVARRQWGSQASACRSTATPPPASRRARTLRSLAAIKAHLIKEWSPEYMPEDVVPPQDSPDVHSERATYVTLDQVLKRQDHLARKTKIVCTAGPACWSEEMLGKLLDAGLSILRLNFSHGDHKAHYEVLERYRKVRWSAAAAAAA